MWEAEGSGENGVRPTLFDGSRSWYDSRTIEDLSKVIFPRFRALSVCMSIIYNLQCSLVDVIDSSWTRPTVSHQESSIEQS